jgi:hypothetical protein
LIQPPVAINGANVLSVADLSETSSTGLTRHIVKGRDVTDFASLAIAQYEGDPGFYLLYCDENWNTITDTYHDTMVAAIAQATFEFGPIVFADLDVEEASEQ